jgi:hypothetical protein
LRATGNDGDMPWIQIGIGVNTGVAYVGAVGTADMLNSLPLAMP